MSDGNRGGAFRVVTTIFGVVVGVLTALLIWDASSSTTRNSVQAERYATEYAERAKERIAENCTPLEPVAAQECVAEVIASTHEQQRDEADLAAQRDMAKYALAMVIVSGFGTVVGVAGLIFIANTLEATREGNAISQDTARRQLRAYLQAELIAGQPVVSNKRIYMTARVKNVGQTPAYFVTSIAQIMTSKRPPSPDNEREIEAALATIPDVENELTLGSSVETHVIKEITAQNEEFADAFGEEVKSAIEGGGHCLVFVGRISYVDIFDQRHVTKFAHVFERRNDQWAATYHERGNHAD